MVRRLFWPLFIIFLVALPPLIYGNRYYIDIFNLTGIYALVVIGLVMLIGYAGQVSLGQNAFFACGGFLTAYMSVKMGLPYPVGALAGIGVSIALATLVGFAALRLSGIYLIMATLAVGIIVWSLLIAFPEYTGGTDGIRGVPHIKLPGVLINSDFRYYFPIWGIVLLFFFITRNIMGSRVGRALRALNSSEEAARSLGINVAKYKIEVFIYSAILASIAGSLYAHYHRGFTPRSVEVSAAIDYLWILFLGGSGVVWGPFIGAGLLKGLPQFLEFFEDYKIIVNGLVLVLVLFYMPLGIGGMLKKLALMGKNLPGLRLLLAEPPLKATRQPLRFVARAEGGASFSPSTNGALLISDGLHKAFGGLVAVDNLSFSVGQKQLKAIIGPNGAGKTTAFNLVAGVYRADRGEVRFKGKKISGLSAHAISSRGLGRTFQIPRLFGNMNVVENIMVGRHPRTRAGFLDTAFTLPATRKEEKAIREEAIAWLSFIGLEERAYDAPLGLPAGEKKLLELARALATDPDLLMLDEPAAGLNEAEKERLAELILKLRSQGITILLVEHDMNFVMGLAEEILVMNYGKKIAEGTPQEVTQNQEVITAYLGPGYVRG